MAFMIIIMRRIFFAYAVASAFRPLCIGSSGVRKNGTLVEFEIYADSDPFLLAEKGCEDEYISCMFISVNSIELHKSKTYGLPLNGWKNSELCSCKMPPRPRKQKVLQVLHIPKTGTSINWFLHDYFDNCSTNGTVPCPKFSSTYEEQAKGLCNGRLFSCAGHRVSPFLPHSTITANTNLITMLRHPWNRLQSNYFYMKSIPSSKILGAEINETHLLDSVNSVYEFSAYPGIANCATKMLSGIQCGAAVEVNETHLGIAKEVLSASLFFGLTEYFKTSVCMLSWMYGGDVLPYHFKKAREGNYTRKTMREALSDEQLTAFLHRERYDLSLYDFAEEMFQHRLQLIGCPNIDI